MSYDVIIVGARCAGATLAALLAKQGMKVLIVDGDRLPSDMPMSTHFMQPPCMDVLDEIGVGDQVRAVAPPSSMGRYRMGEHDVFGAFPEGRPGYCIRRSTIDPMLQEAATAAGAELRDQTRVTDLIMDGERVSGVVVQTPSGSERLHAKLVVGADGRKSTIARLTGVEEYLTYPMERGGYWFYADEPAMWRKDPRYSGWDAAIAWEGDGLRYIFQCDGGQLILVAVPPGEEARSWGADYKAKTVEYLRGSEVTAPLMEQLELQGKGVGLLKAHFFYRRPVGPGFALVGDAGNFKDFVTGHGMADAFLGARRLSKAILVGTDAAYERYWRERDVESMPLYFDAIRMGGVGFNDAFTRQLFAYVSRSEELSSRFGRVADRTLDPFEAFSMPEMLKVLASGMVRGRFDVVKAFLATGKRMQGFGQELSARKALLDALPPAEAAAGAGSGARSVAA